MGEKICKNCLHWEEDRGSKPYYRYGGCPEIIQKVEITIMGDATAQLDIEEDFGCIFFKEATDDCAWDAALKGVGGE